MKELPSEEEEIPFRIKTYKKKELACMYNPNITLSIQDGTESARRDAGKCTKQYGRGEGCG